MKIVLGMPKASQQLEVRMVFVLELCERYVPGLELVHAFILR